MRFCLRTRVTSALIAIVFCLFAGFAWAQDQGPSQLENWDRISNAARTTLQQEDLTVEQLETLRNSVVSWRELFAEAAQEDNAQIDILRQQISALGPEPAEGQTEAPDIAERRAELNRALGEARAPQIDAEAAFAGADALVRRIDDRLRSMQTERVLERQTSPLLPELWGEAIDLLIGIGIKIDEEFLQNVRLKREAGTFWESLPQVIILLAGAFFFIVRGPRWIERLVDEVNQRASYQAQIVLGFLISLGAIFLPLVGISLINAAVISTGLLGSLGRATAIGINFAIGTYAVIRWLGMRIFPEKDSTPTPIPLDAKGRARGRNLAQWGGLVFGVIMVLGYIDDVENFDGVLLSVVAFPLFVLLSFVIVLIGGLIRVQAEPRDGIDGRGYTDFLRGLAGRGLQIAGFASPVLAAIGYFNLSQAILYPVVMTLCVIAFLATFHYVIRSAYGMLRGFSHEEAEAALFPVLISLALNLAALPFVSLFWGVRQSDLAEFWARFQQGVRIGDGTISPADLLTFALVFLLVYMLTRLVQGVLKNTVLPRTKIDAGGRNAIVSGLGYVGITIAGLAGFNAAGIDLTNLTIIVGALGVGIGFGLQTIVNNFVSGIILLIERPIGEGDWVEVNGQMGIVKSISVRSTIIETFDRTNVIVPNGDFISGTVTNWTRGNPMGRVIVPVSVAYGTDTQVVEDILMSVAKEHPIVSVAPPPTVLFRSFGADGLEFEIRAILTDVNYVLSVHSDMNHEIARRFTEQGIEIPFGQRDIWLRNPEALREASPSTDYAGPPQAPREPSFPADPSLASPEDGDGR